MSESLTVSMPPTTSCLVIPSPNEATAPATQIPLPPVFCLRGLGACLGEYCLFCKVLVDPVDAGGIFCKPSPPVFALSRNLGAPNYQAQALKPANNFFGLVKYVSGSPCHQQVKTMPSHASAAQVRLWEEGTPPTFNPQISTRSPIPCTLHREA